MISSFSPSVFPARAGAILTASLAASLLCSLMKSVWSAARAGWTMALSSPATRSPGFSGGLELRPHCCLVGRLGRLRAELTSSLPSLPVLRRPAVSGSEP